MAHTQRIVTHVAATMDAINSMRMQTQGHTCELFSYPKACYIYAIQQHITGFVTEPKQFFFSPFYGIV